jgi:hypothetical protein
MANDADTALEEEMANDADVANEEEMANDDDTALEEEIANDALKAFKAYEAVPCNEPVNELDIKLPLTNMEPLTNIEPVIV